MARLPLVVVLNLLSGPESQAKITPKISKDPFPIFSLKLGPQLLETLSLRAWLFMLQLAAAEKLHPDSTVAGLAEVLGLLGPSVLQVAEQA